jgi:hypothetical protein
MENLQTVEGIYEDGGAEYAKTEGKARQGA